MGCRICTTNDHEALADELAQEMWARCIDSETGSEWEPWETAGPYWQGMFRQYAAAFLKVAQRDHAHDG